MVDQESLNPNEVKVITDSNETESDMGILS